ALSPDTGSVELQRLADAFLVTVSDHRPDGTSTSSALRSTDGRTWAPLDGPVAGRLLVAGDGLVHLQQGDAGQVVVQVSRDAGATWAALDLGALDDSLAD